jgi:exodeoxyribonuclease-3
MKVATWNTNSLRIRVEHLRRWLAETPVDVLCLQETKTPDESFPSQEITALGFPHQAIYGQKSYNGVAILSRQPITNVVKGFALGEPDPQTRLIRGTVNGVELVNVYVPNGNRVGSEKFQYKLAWLKRLRAELDHSHDPTSPLLLCGDINIAPADDDTWDPFEADGQILFHPHEHRALTQLTDWGLTDAFRHLYPTQQQFSWWDYRGGGFPRNHGFRIDHIYLSVPLLARCQGVVIERRLRGWEKPSDHVPVVATLDLP